ncbi:hypothetical protein ALC57_18757 [Trachymyrmex cornetzi]|uniref:Uncharacterized protein n=1 Tax=Trachymyrmex cornetzi TaxID=471704 RepID=A0A151IR86_9HYME|nr:hypothetical protein ALC57_18757 [Trachymyrmex cornetzi]
MLFFLYHRRITSLTRTHTPPTIDPKARSGCSRIRVRSHIRYRRKEGTGAGEGGRLRGRIDGTGKAETDGMRAYER